MLKILRLKKSEDFSPYSNPEYAHSAPYAPSFRSSASLSPSRLSITTRSPSNSPLNNTFASASPSPTASRADLGIPTPVYARFARSASGTELRLDFLDQDQQSEGTGRSGLGKVYKPEEHESAQGNRSEGKALPPPPPLSPPLSPPVISTSNPALPSQSTSTSQAPSTYRPPANLNPGRSSLDSARVGVARSVSKEYKTEQFDYVHSRSPSAPAPGPASGAASASASTSTSTNPTENRTEEMPFLPLPRRKPAINPSTGLPYPPLRTLPHSQAPYQHAAPEAEAEPGAESRGKGKLVKAPPRGDSLGRFGGGGWGRDRPGREVVAGGPSGSVERDRTWEKRGEREVDRALGEEPPRSMLRPNAGLSQVRAQGLGGRQDAAGRGVDGNGKSDWGKPAIAPRWEEPAPPAGFVPALSPRSNEPWRTVNGTAAQASTSQPQWQDPAPAPAQPISASEGWRTNGGPYRQTSSAAAVRGPEVPGFAHALGGDGRTINRVNTYMQPRWQEPLPEPQPQPQPPRPKVDLSTNPYPPALSRTYSKEAQPQFPSEVKPDPSPRPRTYSKDHPTPQPQTPSPIITRTYSTASPRQKRSFSQATPSPVSPRAEEGLRSQAEAAVVLHLRERGVDTDAEVRPEREVEVNPQVQLGIGQRGAGDGVLRSEGVQLPSQILAAQARAQQPQPAQPVYQVQQPQSRRQPQLQAVPSQSAPQLPHGTHPFPTSSTPLTPPHSPRELQPQPQPNQLNQPKRSFLFVSGGKVEPLYRGPVPVSPPPHSFPQSQSHPHSQVQAHYSTAQDGSPTSPLSPSSHGSISHRGKLVKKRSTASRTSDHPLESPSQLRAVDGASISPSLASKRSFAPGSFRSPVPGSPPTSRGGGGVFGFVRRLSESRAARVEKSVSPAEEAHVRVREGRRRSQVEPEGIDDLRRMLYPQAQADNVSILSGENFAGVGAGVRSLDSHSPRAGASQGQGQGQGRYVYPGSTSVSAFDRAKGRQAHGYHGRRAASEVDLRQVDTSLAASPVPVPVPASAPIAAYGRTGGTTPASSFTRPSNARVFVASPSPIELVTSPEEDPSFSDERTPTATRAFPFRQPAADPVDPGYSSTSTSTLSSSRVLPSGSGGLIPPPSIEARTPSPAGGSREDHRRSAVPSLADSSRLGASTASFYSQESEEEEKDDEGDEANTARLYLTSTSLSSGPGQEEARGSVVSLGAPSVRELTCTDSGLDSSGETRVSLYKSPYLPSDISTSDDDVLDPEPQPEYKEDAARTPTRTTTVPLNDKNKPLAASASILRRTPARRQSTSSEDLNLRTNLRGAREMDRPERDARGVVPVRASMDSSSSDAHGNGSAKGAGVSKTSSSASSYVTSSEAGVPPSNVTSVSAQSTTRHRLDAGAVKPAVVPFPKSPERQYGHYRRPSDPRYKLPPPRTVPPPVVVPPQEERGPQELFLTHILVEPEVLAQLLQYLSFRDFLALLHINHPTRGACEERRLRELILERYLDTVGYRRWPRHLKRDEPLTLSLKDLNAYLMGVSIATYQYASAADTYLQSQSHDPAALALCRSFTGATRSYTRVVLRLRAQAEAGWDSDAFRSPLYRSGHAPLLRVFVPSPQGGWLGDESVVECEKELRRAGVMKLVRRGDVVWDAAVSDEGNIGRLIWDGNYLLDLEYNYSPSGQLPHYFNSLAYPPSYWHKVIRTNTNPLAFIDLRPYGREIMQNVQLVQDRVQSETPQGGYHTIVGYSHRSVARLLRGTPIPESKEVVDAGWDGRIIVETEGTNEGLADLQLRCSSRGTKSVYRILREKSRPGEVWIRCVRAKEKILQ